MDAKKALRWSGLVLTVVFVGRVNAGTCYIDDSVNGRTSPIQAGGGAVDDFGGTDLCHGPSGGGHEVHGTACTLEVLLNSAGRSGSGTCLSIGKGVTVQMGNHTIDCPDSAAPCGTAIQVTDSSSGANNKVILDSGTITGCWSKAILGSGGSDATVDGFIVDLTGIDVSLGGHCSGDGDAGLQGALKTVTETVVSHVDGDCVELGSGTISNSIAHDCGGSGLVVPGSNVMVDHVGVFNVTNGFERPIGGGSITLKDSTVRDATCAFYNPPPFVYCFDSPGGTGWVTLQGRNFVQDMIFF